MRLWNSNAKSKRWRVMPLLLWFALLLVAAGHWSCSPARLELDLYYPHGDGSTVFQRISRFSISVKGESLKSGDGAEFDPSEDKQNILPNIECNPTSEGETPRLEIEVLGLTGQGAVFASGRSVLFHKCGEKKNIPVLLSPKGQFSTLTAFFRPQQGLPFTEAAQMNEVRAGHQVVTLSDGRLLITGGANVRGLGKIQSVSGETDIFDPTTGIFTKGPSMSSNRAFHTATVIGDSVVVVGGLDVINDQIVPVRNIDIFTLNAAGKLVRQDGPALVEGRAFHTATRLGSTNNILVFGGMTWVNGTQQMAAKWEIHNPGESAVLASGDVDAANRRAMHASAVLTDTGRILLAGGLQVNSSGNIDTLNTALTAFTIEQAGQLRAVLETISGSMKSKRAGHTATVLENGDVLLVGGMEARADNIFVPQTVVKTMEVIKKDGTFATGDAFNLDQARVFHSTIRLTDGRVLVYGGINRIGDQGANKDVAFTADRAEIFNSDPDNGIRPTPLKVLQRKDRFMQSATRLLNGSVVIIGGVAPPAGAPDYVTLSRGEMFNPGPTSQ